MRELNHVCYRTLGVQEPYSLERYLSLGGYSTLKKIITDKIPAKNLLESIVLSGLRGRGGAGFSTGAKWGFVSGKNHPRSYLVCNADESEPGACKDRDILRFNPHQVIEGMIIGAYITGATTGYCYLRGEFADEPYKRMKHALAQAYELGFLGQSILGSSFSFDLHLVLGAGAYICGEETALLESIEGKKGLPRFKPPFPANVGLYGSPTTINNVESFACVPVVLEKGHEWFLQQGHGKSGGTKIFSVTGHVARPGNYEVGMGIPFRELLELAGGLHNKKSLKAVIPGGSSTPILPASIIESCTMDYESIAQAGSMLGAGSVIVLDEDTDLPWLLERISLFYYRESCGQCSPCREGTGWLYRVLQRINQGTGQIQDLDELNRIAAQIAGKTICAFGDAAAMPVQSFIKHFRSEFEEKIKRGAL